MPLVVAPPVGGDAVSELFEPHSRRLRHVEITNPTIQVAEEPGVADPPWVESFVAGEAPKDARPRPPTVGVPQASTTVELVRSRAVGGGGSRTLVARDGVFDPGTGETSGATQRHWLPRFREQTVARPGETEPGRAVGPLFVSMRLEDGATAPDAIEVQLRQRTIDDGVEVMPWTEVSRLPLVAYSTSEATANVVALPYPAWVTRTPSLRIVDNNRLRQYEFRKQIADNRRFANIVWGAIRGATSSSTPTTPALDASKPVLDYMLGAKAEADWPQVFRIITIAVSPLGQRLWDTAASLLDYKFVTYESKNPPPAEEMHEISIHDTVGVMQRLVDTRAGDGSTEGDRSLGLTPLQLRKKGFRKDSALLEYLIYGSRGAVRRDPSDPGAAVRNTSGEVLSGNLLDPRGMDPYFCTESRVETQMRVLVTDASVTRTYQFDALRSNALDAGWLMAGYERDRAQLKRLARRLQEKLTPGGIDALSWLNRRLVLKDATYKRYNILGRLLARDEAALRAQQRAGV